MRRPLALTFVLLVALSGCMAHWSGYPKNVPSERRCQYFKAFPQLIEIPGLTNAWQMVHDCETHAAEKTAIAMTWFLHEWEKEFGISFKVRANLNSLLVEYGRGEKEGGGFDVSGAYIPMASYKGLTITKGTIWVKVKSNDLLCESSLVHELIHASIWAVKGTDGDPDHLGNKYYGWTVRHQMVMQRTNEKLCRLGL